ncbi:MAG TPA: hypothetical protein VFE41_26595 [Acetobacteraceae bacterium]|nr:hypothetical protein [Acetobacteraceae bacterium]
MRGFDPALRGEMAAPVFPRLTEAMAAGLHNDYLLACGFAVMTLVLAAMPSARLRPRGHALRR